MACANVPMPAPRPTFEREEKIRRNIGLAIRAARLRAGLSQSETQARLARALGVDVVAPATLSRYERGERSPSFGTLDALCEVLGAGEGALMNAIQTALTAPPSRNGARKPRP